MFRRTLAPIAKRSARCRSGSVFYRFSAPNELAAHHRPGRSLVRSSPPRRVVSSTTKTTASASPPAGALRGGSVPEAGLLRHLLQRAAPVISKDAIRDALPIIGNGAYMALASGFLMTDMLHLRLMLVGGYAGLVTFHSLHAKPLQIPLRWSALFVVVNAGAAMLLFVDQWIGALLSDEEKALYEKHFRDGLTPGQFYHLLKMASTKEVDDGNVLTQEGRVSPYLYFIEKGQAKVFHRGTFASYVDEGGFVNDVAFQRTDDDCSFDEGSSSSSSNDEIRGNSAIHEIGNDGPTERTPGVGAYGTVIANGDCKVWVWDQTELKDFLRKRPEMDRSMKYTLSRHLVRSLLKQREVRRQVSRGRREALEKTELTMPERREFRRTKTSPWP
mmetsp:Transcript_864/g.1807  ORF Transcript_864/g.1807 Transcript_864/m.1807 type:complete len:387 (+) Transcript_864:320-1480(+)